MSRLSMNAEFLNHPINKREAILEASLHLLANKGFHGFSIKQVADHAGVAAGTVYLYFKDREDLILQLHTQISEKVAQVIFAEHDPHQSLFNQYRQLCQSFWQMFADQPDILLSKVQFDHLPPDVLRERHEGAKSIFHPLIAFFERGRHELVMKNFSDEILFSLGFEPYFALARKQMLGLVEVTTLSLESLIAASWDAIATHGDIK